MEIAGSSPVTAASRKDIMENPATWGAAENVIRIACDQFYEDVHGDPPIVGLSLPCRIADALRNAGLLKENNNED